MTKETKKRGAAKKKPVAVKRKPLTKPKAPVAEEGMQMIALERVYPNAEQARKIFEESKLRELAASIRVQGLMNPIVVRPDGEGRFMIVAGERRFRACQLLELKEVPVIIKKMDDEALTCQMIIENLQRQDITPLEEARAFRKAMQDFDYSVEQLAARIGISQPHRILDRLTLLNLKEEYQVLLEDDFLTPTQAYYMSKVPTEFQDTFWRMIRDGRVDTNSLAAVAQGFIDTANQVDLFPESRLSAEEVKALRNLETYIESMAGTVSRFFNKDGEMDILKKIDPARALTIAEKIRVIGSVLTLAEKKLRAPAAHQRVIVELGVQRGNAEADADDVAVDEMEAA